MRQVAQVAVLPALAVGAVLLAAPAAQATSCATDPRETPQAIASATYRDESGRDFFDRYDMALLGTVTAKSIDARTSRTTVSFDIAGLLGRTDAPSVIDVTIPDDGALNGYEYEIGRGYFVPLEERTPDGLSNFSFLCDPIAEVADPAASFTELAALARARGLPASAPVQPTASPASRSPETGVSTGTATAAGALVVLSAAGVVVAVRRRQEQLAAEPR